MIELRSYVDPHGRSPFEHWYEKLDESVRARIVVSLDRLSRNACPVKGVGAGVLELRMDFGPGYRIYLGKDGDTLVILLAGGTKRRQQADIGTAQQLWREYKRRKQESGCP